MSAESILDRAALPDGFGYLLLVLGLILTLAPYFAATDFGLLKIPNFSAEARHRLKLFGPLALATAIFLHLPIISPNGGAPVTALGKADQPSSSDSEPAVPSDQGILPREPTDTVAVHDPELALVGASADDIFAEWHDSGCLYQVSVMGEGETATVRFPFGRQIPAAQTPILRPVNAEIAVGDHVYVETPLGRGYAPARVLELRQSAQRALVEVDTAVRCADDFEKSSFWARAAAILTVEAEESE